MSQLENRNGELHQAIRSVLLHDWDPIGIQDIPEAADEYDHYIPAIYSMLIAHRTPDELADYLIWLEGEQMGLSPNPSGALLVAKKLVGIAS